MAYITWNKIEILRVKFVHSLKVGDTHAEMAQLVDSSRLY